MISVKNKFLVVALVAGISFSPVMAARQTETNEERERAVANYNKYLMIAGGGSAVALAAGFALGDNMLKGIGQGGLSGTASGYLQNEFDLSTLPILTIWFGEWFTRKKFSRAIAIPSSDDVSAEVAAANIYRNLLEQNVQNQALLGRRPTDGELTARLLRAKGIDEVKNAAWIASWVTYLGCYMMYQKVRQAAA